mgnify:CR=1 FL=1
MERDWQKIGFWTLRLGLALTYLYSGFDLILHPTAWTVYLPLWFKELLPFAPTLYLQIQGAAELLFALSFLTGFQIRWAGLLAAFEMAMILLFYGLDGISFRDIAILGAALSIFFFTLAPRQNGERRPV